MNRPRLYDGNNSSTMLVPTMTTASTGERNSRAMRRKSSDDDSSSLMTRSSTTSTTATNRATEFDERNTMDSSKSSTIVSSKKHKEGDPNVFVFYDKPMLIRYMGTFKNGQENEGFQSLKKHVLKVKNQVHDPHMLENEIYNVRSYSIGRKPKQEQDFMCLAHWDTLKSYQDYGYGRNNLVKKDEPMSIDDIKKGKQQKPHNTSMQEDQEGRCNTSQEESAQDVVDCDTPDEAPGGTSKVTKLLEQRKDDKISPMPEVTDSSSESLVGNKGKQVKEKQELLPFSHYCETFKTETWCLIGRDARSRSAASVLCVDGQKQQREINAKDSDIGEDRDDEPYTVFINVQCKEHLLDEFMHLLLEGQKRTVTTLCSDEKNGCMCYNIYRQIKYSNKNDAGTAIDIKKSQEGSTKENMLNRSLDQKMQKIFSSSITKKKDEEVVSNNTALEVEKKKKTVVLSSQFLVHAVFQNERDFFNYMGNEYSVMSPMCLSYLTTFPRVTTWKPWFSTATSEHGSN